MENESSEVTERGRPVPQLTPLPSDNSVIARLAAEGSLAQIGNGNLADLGRPPPARPGEISISDALQELREDTI